jgi:colicin import membrane protein
MNKDLDLVSTALAEFSAVEAGLQALRQQYAGVVYDVTTTDGMDAAKAARLAIREPRYAVERIRKAAKAPIIALGKTLDADAARITAELEKIENPIDQQIKLEEARKEREREAKIAAEAARVESIQWRIAELRGRQELTPASGSGLIGQHIADLEAIPVDESFEEFYQQALDAKTGGLARLSALHASALAHEAEQARIKAEREELARLRAEQETRDRIERERIAAEEREAKKAREAADREAAEQIRIEREKLAEERRQQDAAAAAETARLAAERAELTRQQEAEAARRKAEQREALEREEAGQRERKRLEAVTARPTDAQIIECVAAHFGVTPATAAGWLASMRAAA